MTHKPGKGRRIIEMSGLGEFEADAYEIMLERQRKIKPKAKMPKRFTNRRADRG